MNDVKLDPKEERAFDALRKLGQKLHVPIPEAKWKLEVLLGGKVVQSYEARCHSWTRNAYNTLFSALAGVDGDDAVWGGGNVNIKNPAGVVDEGPYPICADRTFSFLTASKGYTAGAGLATTGIVVGSGTNVEDFENHVLQTLIVNGTGAGELNYVASEAYAISYAGLVLSAELVRYFNNNTVGETDVNVNEVGLIMNGYCDQVYQPWYNARDHLASTVVVPSTGQLKVTYIISLTYPS